MPQRVITAAVGVAGLVAIGLGVASATVWRADDVLVATSDPGSHLVVTDPGVLELGGDPVTVRATTSGGDPVVLAVGRDTDVAGWVGSDPHTQVTGLSGWHDLAIKQVPQGAPGASAGPSSPGTSPTTTASPTPTPSPSAAAGDGATSVADPTDSDLWVVQATGKGSAELVWPTEPGRWSLLAVGTGDSAPTLQLSWPRVVATPWLWPLVVLGSLMVLAAAVVLGRDWYRRRTGTVQEWQPVTTGTIAVVGEGGTTLTRRQIREAQQAAARPRTGAVPRVAAPQPPATDAPADEVAPPTPTPAPAEASPVAESHVGPATAPTAAIPTTRRALRTGAIPTVGTQPPARSQSQSQAQPEPEAQPQSPAQAQSPAKSAGPGWLSGGRRGGDESAHTAGPQRASGATLADAETTALPAVDRPSPTDAPRSVQRPAWLPLHDDAHGATPEYPSATPAAPGTPPHETGAAAPTPQGSRADAWRRAWGLPPVDDPAATHPQKPAQPSDETTDESPEDDR